MALIEHTIEDGMAYTSVNGTRGTLNYIDTEIIIYHAKKIPSGGRYIETGSYLGCSALLVALHSDATVWAHDIWVTDWSELKGCPPPEVKDYFYEFYKSVKKNKLENRIIPVRGKSEYTIGIHDDASVDLAFVDGDHSYEGCIADLNAVWPKVKEGCPILVHDCHKGSEAGEALIKFCRDKDAIFETFTGSCGMVCITR